MDGNNVRFEPGKRYLFKTPTWYYIATLITVDFGGYYVNELVEVAETGPLDKAFKGEWKSVEKYPEDALAFIPAGGTVVIEYKVGTINNLK